MTANKKYILLLTTIWSLLYLAGNQFLPITDPVEGNYVETAREMLLYGDYLSPRIFGEFWYDKPVLFYWELAAAFQLCGIHNFAARLAPAMMALAGILLLYWWARRLYTEKIAFVAGLVLATSLEYWCVGHAVITDMTLLVTVSLCLIAFYTGYREKKPHWFYLAYGAAGLAVLDKGPIGLCLPGLIILLFLLWQRDLKALLVRETFIGLVVFFGVIGIWYLPMFFLHGRDFLDVFFGVHNVMRATVSEHPKDNVWYFYPAMFFAGFFPWVWGAIPAGWKRIRRGWHWQLDTDTRFLLVWAVTVVAVFQCFATKYVTYTFPYMFPVVLLLARWLAGLGKKFYCAVAAMIVAYVALLVWVAVPQMTARSAVSLAEVAKPFIHETTGLYCYREDGSVSMTFYTGHFMRELCPAREMERKGGLDWSVTNVMPQMAIEQVDKEQPMLVITNEQDGAELQEVLSGKWQLLATAGKRVLYYREP
ncbi:MAG: glycosyltransferase family 39 protein [Selenomonadaceae bacterium]|nr:glycosyltransferase family 39 protein [Selenomonadaceae bacterium]